MRVNDQIRAEQVRLIGDEGDVYGIVAMSEAFKISEEKGLDLIEVSPNAKPPVVKLMDFGKYKYQLQKKASEAKKKQVTIVVKEIKFRPNIDSHDLGVKLKKAKQFLEHGDKVKLLMQFRGREMAHLSLGKQRFDEIIKQVLELGATVESESKVMGNRIFAMVAPNKK
jgi:translation initiation factor IF-3